MLRYAWGGVGCDIIRQYCKTWCDATLRMGWGGVWYCSSLLQDMMWCYATHGVGWGVILFVSTARHDVMLRYAWGGVGWVVISFVSTARQDVMLRNWRSCKISHAVKRKGHFVRSSGFAAQNPVRVAHHSKADVFFLMVVCHMKSRWRHSETTIFGQSWAGARSAGMFVYWFTWLSSVSLCLFTLSYRILKGGWLRKLWGAEVTMTTCHFKLLTLFPRSSHPQMLATP